MSYGVRESDGLRLMLLVTSNAYRDREGEIIREKALQQYVESSWKDDEFVGDNPLVFWHSVEPIGDIIYADMEGPFLIEVARERPNAVVNIARDGEPPVEAEIKEVWDGLQSYPDELGASHEFFYLRPDRADKVFENIIKTETSVLPLENAANIITLAEILDKEQDL